MARAVLRSKTGDFPLDIPIVTIGRDPACSLCSDDQELSRKHAMVIEVDHRHCVIDFKSSNGVFVNNKQLFDPYYLQTGDLIRMGETVFEYYLEEEKTKASASGAAAGDGAVFHTMLDLERSLQQDTITMLDDAEPAESDAFDKLVLLYNIAKMLNSQVLDLKGVLNDAMDLALKVLAADRGFIMLHNPKTNKLETTVSREMDSLMAQDGPTPISRSIVEETLAKREPVLTQDALQDQRFQTSGSIQMYNIRSAMCVPLVSKDKIIGVLYVDNRIQSDCFEDDDLRLLAAFGDQAAVAIDNARLYSKVQDETRKRNNLSRYLSPDLVDKVINEELSPNLGGQKVRATILFSDIRGFTTFSESRGPQEIVTMLNTILSRMTSIIFQCEGTLDKYIGDAIMAVFGAPFNPQNAPIRAIMCALKMQEEMTRINAEWQLAGVQPLHMGIGINTGEVTAGNVGYQDPKDPNKSRLDFTVIGDAVNTSARLESISGPGEVLISAETLSLVKDWVEYEQKGERMVKGKKTPVQVFKVLRIRQEAIAAARARSSGVHKLPPRTEEVPES